MAIEVQDVSTSATPSNNNTLADENKKEMFKLSTDMSLKNAEDMSLSISSLTEGKIDIDHYMNTVHQIWCDYDKFIMFSSKFMNKH